MNIRGLTAAPPAEVDNQEEDPGISLQRSSGGSGMVQVVGRGSFIVVLGFWVLTVC